MVGTAALTGAIVSAFLIKKDRKPSIKDIDGDEKVHNLRYYYSRSKDSPEKELLRLIDTAKETIDVAVFYITDTAIVTQLCKAAKRGVSVRIITDKDENYQQQAYNKLINVGIPIRINTYEGKMHLKNMIIDQKIITTGSYNFTYAAEAKNEEVVIISDNVKIASEWSKKFEDMWSDHNNYVPYRRDYLRQLA